MARTREPKPQWLADKKLWRIRWTDENGKRPSECFPADQYEVAAYKLKKYRIEVEEIKKGLRLPKPPDKTFDDLCSYWLHKKAIGKRSRKHDESIIRCHLLPFFGSQLVRNIGVEQVDIFCSTKQHLNKKTVSNHLTLPDSPASSL